MDVAAAEFLPADELGPFADFVDDQCQLEFRGHNQQFTSFQPDDWHLTQADAESWRTRAAELRQSIDEEHVMPGMAALLEWGLRPTSAPRAWTAAGPSG